MRRPAFYVFTCVCLSGCITNTQTSQNAQIMPVGGAVVTRQVAPVPAPTMTPAARLANAQLITVNKTTMAGATLTLASPQALAPDCSPLGKVDAKVITQPNNGTIRIEDGAAFPNFTPGDPPYKCNGKKHPATLISYQASSGFSGQDTAVVQIFFPDGKAPTIRFQIAVR